MDMTDVDMGASNRFQRLRAADLTDWLARHPQALILDARDEGAHGRVHLNGAIRLDGRNHERLLMREAKDRAVFIYCYHGNASQVYADMFIDFGFETVADLIGGWEACVHLPEGERLSPNLLSIAHFKPHGVLASQILK